MAMVLEDVTVREGFTTITPYLQVPDSGLFDFLTTVFGAVETGRTTTPRGLHREVQIGDSMLMIGEGPLEEKDCRPRSTCTCATSTSRSSGRSRLAPPPPARPRINRAASVRGSSRTHGATAKVYRDASGRVPYPARTAHGHAVHPPARRSACINSSKQAFSAVEEFRHESERRRDARAGSDRHCGDRDG